MIKSIIQKKILLVGAGGHATSCIDVLEEQNEYKIFGLVDNNSKFKVLNNYKILGNDSKANNIFKACKYALVAVGQIKSSELRKKLFLKYKKIGFKFPSIKSPECFLSKHSKIGEGTILMHRSIINNEVVIGKNCIINTASIIEHEVTIGNWTHISTGVILNGQVKVGNNTFVGSGTVVRNNINIGNNVIIGANLYISKDVKDNSIIK